MFATYEDSIWSMNRTDMFIHTLLIKLLDTGLRSENNDCSVIHWASTNASDRPCHTVSFQPTFWRTNSSSSSSGVSSAEKMYCDATFGRRQTPAADPGPLTPWRTAPAAAARSASAVTSQHRWPVCQIDLVECCFSTGATGLRVYQRQYLTRRITAAGCKASLLCEQCEGEGHRWILCSTSHHTVMSQVNEDRRAVK